MPVMREMQMGILNIPMFGVLTDKMRWHQTRQGVLAENVANAETPGYAARELKPFDMEKAQDAAGSESMTTVATQPGHFSVHATSGTGFSSITDDGFEITPDGNGVTLEEQMTKVASNQIDFQTVTALYTRSIRILKTALSKTA